MQKLQEEKKFKKDMKEIQKGHVAKSRLSQETWTNQHNTTS